MKGTPLKKLLIDRLFFFFCLFGAAVSVGAAEPYKIGLVHSYEKNYPDAERYRRTLEKELSACGITFEIKELFLNCNELLYDKEMERASFFIDELTSWGADIIGIFNNQATYSLLKCNNPKLRHVPAVFCGLYHPDEDLIREYPNVTGYVDIPDYTRAVRMIESIMGKSRIVVMSGKGMIDSKMWMDLEKQCRDSGIETSVGDLLEHTLSHRVVRGAYEEDKERLYNERIDTTVVIRMMSEVLPLRTIQQVARGSETYLMLTSFTYNTLDAPEFFANPSFGVINEGFGSNDKMLGGYFSPLEIQLKEMAKGICLRLRGEMPERQIIQCPKEYVLNWHVLQQYGISAENLPPEYKVMYIPFHVKYRYYILFSCLLAGVAFLYSIIYLIYSLLREKRRKKEALRNLLYEHKTLKLAIEGGTTYAWRKEQPGLTFDSHFYQLINHPHRFITLDELYAFVHPEDAERFCSCFLKGDKHTDYKGQYRCNFGGEYRWWEFRYSFVHSHGQGEPVVTGLLQNVQDVKDREAELIEARSLAEKAELKQSFLNNMSHEIRTPLNAIVGFSNLLVGTPDLQEEEKKEFAAIINTNTGLLLNLINDILELSRIDSGLISFSWEEASLRMLLNSYYQTFAVQIKPELDFIRDFPEEDVTVHVDAMRLQQVITNFLTNANKFTAAGYIKLGYCCVRNETENVVRVFVEDSGKGIPANELKMIFSRFYKHDEFIQGTGLGLAICTGIAERMGGRIDVESEEGKGSRFTIVLPLAWE